MEGFISYDTINVDHLQYYLLYIYITLYIYYTHWDL